VYIRGSHKAACAVSYQLSIIVFLRIEEGKFSEKRKEIFPNSGF
jgi:hypothetical protein